MLKKEVVQVEEVDVFQQFQETYAEVIINYEKAIGKGNKSAGVRFRKGLSELTKLGKELKKNTLESGSAE